MTDTTEFEIISNTDVARAADAARGVAELLRAAAPDLASFPPVTISRLLAWVEHGRLVDPWDRDGGHVASH